MSALRSLAYRLKMCCAHQLPHWLHNGVPNDDADVTARVAIRLARQHLHVFAGERVRRRANVELKLPPPSLGVRQRDQDALHPTSQPLERVGKTASSPHLFEASLDSHVQGPRQIGRTQHQDAVVIGAHTLHLHQELCLDAPGRLALAFATGPAERVDLIDKHNGRPGLSRHGEELLDQSLTLAHPLADQVTRRNTEERRFRFGRDGFGDVGLAGTGGTIHEDAAPRSALADEEMGELDRQDDSFFQGVLGRLEAGDIFPFDIGHF